MSEGLPPGISIASFSEGYRKFFEVVPATDDSLKLRNYRLRHEVYACELGWEPLRADGAESDDYDRHALHCLVRAVATQRFVGCARLVLADPADPAAPLPFERACAATLDRRTADPARMDRSRIGEMSRLAVVADYRRRQGEGNTSFAINDDFGIGPRLRLPYLSLGLYLALIAMARWRGLTTLFALTEPAQLRAIARLGIDIVRIGAPARYHGERIPTMIDVGGVIGGMAPYLRPFFDTIADEIERAMRAAAT